MCPCLRSFPVFVYIGAQSTLELVLPPVYVRFEPDQLINCQPQFWPTRLGEATIAAMLDRRFPGKIHQLMSTGGSTSCSCPASTKESQDVQHPVRGRQFSFRLQFTAVFPRLFMISLLCQPDHSCWFPVLLCRLLFYVVCSTMSSWKN